ncbi:SigE family RNA polymerase sigma factor [Nocardioides oleivorans]|uniref:SigE family RNA polymerase sigma factor n=1 Tax=Nocardioides oleivorans TaxID=273676 RepID=A0A4Q2S0R0_9ACTN|nr:SigE family RNA polymerase sigma factor [Nocardioides oleivorans]RYB95211.1 SigE family RNA polymerase sigma factor [Nocardioides oleivorans]
MRGSASVDEEFTSFVASASPQLHRKAWLLTTSSAAAEDLLQSALAKAYVNWRRVSAADDPTAYVSGIVLKTFLSDRRRRSSTEVAVAEVDDCQAVPDDAALRLTLLAALRTLAPLDRAVVVLRYWEDLSVEETAQTLHLSSAAVKNRALRSLAALRTQLGDAREPILSPEAHR